MVGIVDVLEKETVCRNTVACILSVLTFDDTSETFYGESTPPHFDEGADDSAHHVAQETVGLDSEHPSVVVARCPMGMHDAAIVGFHVGVQFAETGEVSVVGKTIGSLVHQVEIEVIAHTPSILTEERILAMSDVVAIGTTDGIESCMGFGDYLTHFIYADVGWQQTVELGCYFLRVELGGEVEMSYHKPGMYAGIGTSCSNDFDRETQNSR